MIFVQNPYFRHKVPANPDRRAAMGSWEVLPTALDLSNVLLHPDFRPERKAIGLKISVFMVSGALIWSERDVDAKFQQTVYRCAQWVHWASP